MPETPVLFDRDQLRRNRQRVVSDGGPVSFLHDIARDEVSERLIEVNRTFTRPAVVTGTPSLWGDVVEGATVVEDAETLALEPGAHDLMIHAMALHWANDPVGQLIQCRRALAPDGLLLAVFFGGRTLEELRATLATAETRVSGGLSPRIAPMGDVRDLGALISRAGLALPVADTLRLPVTYPDLPALMRDLRGMGEGNAMAGRTRSFTGRKVFEEAGALYASHHGDGAGRLCATYELVFLAGWAPDESQQQPLRPGSAKTRLADALGTLEIPADDTAPKD
ncbi:MAG: methyltransferase domain-containing protein [Pseudomonadota bacterium]